MIRLLCFPFALALATSVAIVTPDVLAQPLPSFTNPTNITNQYYPVSKTKQAITLGVDDGEAYRSEVTLLPGTRSITWAGGVTQARISQFVAYKSGDLVEVAYDYFAQADNGDLYYFGEDVFNYVDGVIDNTNGTWLAGQDGAPPGLLMPGDPIVGQVFYPENFAPLVFEEATVVSLTEQSRTPLGQISNGLLIHELLLDGSEELKVYAAGWGQVEVRETNAMLYLAQFIGTQSAQRQIPGHLDDVGERLEDIFSGTLNWNRIRSRTESALRSWNRYRWRAAQDGVPQAFVDDTNASLGMLRDAVFVRNPALMREAANDALGAIADVTSAYNNRVPADVARLEVLERDLVLDVQSGDWTAARIEHAKAVDAVWARLRPFLVLRQGGQVLATRLEAQFAAQDVAIEDENAADAVRASRRAREILEQIEDRF